MLKVPGDGSSSEFKGEARGVRAAATSSCTGLRFDAAVLWLSPQEDTPKSSGGGAPTEPGALPLIPNGLAGPGESRWSHASDRFFGVARYLDPPAIVIPSD